MARRRLDLSPLAGVTPFDRYPRRHLRPLAAHTDRLRVPQDTVLARQGGLVRELVIVVAGEVVASREGGQTRRAGAGARFGGCELLTGAPHPETLVAASELEVLVVNGPAYRGAAQTLPGLAERAEAWLPGETAGEPAEGPVWGPVRLPRPS